MVTYGMVRAQIPQSDKFSIHGTWSLNLQLNCACMAAVTYIC